jgi:hypothetical protein
MLNLQKVLSLATQFAYARTERYNIHGVRIEHNNNQLCAKATNGHIAIIITTEYNDIHNLPTGNYTIELPKVKQINELLKIDNEYVISRKLDIIDIEFPDFTRIVSTVNENTEYAIENLWIDPELLLKLCQVAKNIEAEYGQAFAKTRFSFHRHPNMPIVCDIEHGKFSIKMIAMTKQL